MRKLFFIIPLLALVFAIVLIIGYAQHSCPDGTFIGDCSVSKISYYCDASKNLIFNCELCGCQIGQACLNNTCLKELTPTATSALAAELGLPEGYNAEFLLKPDLLSPLFIAATSHDQLLVAEHYGSRLLRINPITGDIKFLYQLPRDKWHGLLSDGSDGVYLSMEGKIIAHIYGDGTYT